VGLGNMTTTPTFAEIPLLGAESAPRSGAAFELQDPARESEVVALDGWEAEVHAGQQTIVVRCGSEANYGDAIRSGLTTAQKALDLMSIRGGNNLVSKAFDDEHVIWWVAVGAGRRRFSPASCRLARPASSGT
jgi:hypothetical protein